MGQQRVAVIGAGTCGVSMLKTLSEDGFKVTCYERRKQVGGLWAYTDDPSMTTALPSTRALISKYTCGMTDFPMPDKYPSHLSSAQFQEYIESYARHFDLLKDVVFGASVIRATRNEEDTAWRLEMLVNGEPQSKEFDKVVFCHGYQTNPEMPDYEGKELFKGQLLHAQQFRKADGLEGKNIVVVGMSSTASDIINNLLPVASKVYMSHRRGGFILPNWRKGVPGDLLVTWRRRQMGAFLQRRLPRVYTWLTDKALSFLMRSHWGRIDPDWRVLPSPSVSLSLPGASSTIIPLLQEGKLVSLHGIKRFTGPRSIEFNDGTILDDIDAVICATGYSADFTVAPFLESNRPANYGGPDLVRLWNNIFPPQYADSMALLCHSAYGKNNGFSFNDVQSMAISNIFRGVHPLPPLPTMNKQIDTHNKWLASRWRAESLGFDPSAVQTWKFQQFLHEVAGTGMENLGWGWKGWKFFFRDPKMSYLMNNGVETAHAFRYFETGKRKTWDGAREAIIRANEAVKVFPVKGGKEKI
ncbi:putative dimethylaniline monooxygenase [Cucurbitaria berberidis CBS 394.84]|uniref:Dimethylaniline monooxygenase n=1 Tax=Cucurbitaria berberidis CBS 394.84 TaxID=1168544 RepID=A0A9P4L6A3_9PLEO|nr:putative dimethylaniline monooxygenase [Cucurbitaria berberidis CBS 394.84]KAF1842858.1 putative dimethylaniline monooxygenase [Cucurbitaria berberidis CBS 394.84]